MLRLLFWESTIQCNLTCAHCRRLESNEATDTDMTTDQAKDMIDQLAVVGAQQPMMPILVFSGGEPLVRKDLFELVTYARSKDLIVALATNGTLIDEASAGKIKESGVARVSISLDGTDYPDSDWQGEVILDNGANVSPDLLNGEVTSSI